MNLKEMFIALAEGKSVRRACWPAGEFIYLSRDCDNDLRDERGDRIYLDLTSGGEWEIYEKPSHFINKLHEAHMKLRQDPNYKVLVPALGNLIDRIVEGMKILYIRQNTIEMDPRK